MNPVLPVLLSHRSVRAYRDKPVPDGLLETIVAAGQSASTSSNLQLWSVVAIEDKARKERLSELCGGQKHIRDCPLFLVWLADGSRIARAAELQGVKAEGLDYVEAVMLAVVDAALAAQNAVVAMESQGLGIVYIGGIRNNMDKVAEELKLPPYVFPCFGMCVGWPSESVTAKVKPRLPQPAVLHRETYTVAQEAAPIAAYDATLTDFQERVGMKPRRLATHHRAAHANARSPHRPPPAAGNHGEDGLPDEVSKASPQQHQPDQEAPGLGLHSMISTESPGKMAKCGCPSKSRAAASCDSASTIT